MLVKYSGTNHLVFLCYKLKFSENYLTFSIGVHYYAGLTG